MRTQLNFSYGFRNPMDLVEKLERERALFSVPPDRDQIFNTMITGDSLCEWTTKAFAKEVKIAKFGKLGKGCWQVPEGTPAYIVDTDDAGMVPNAPEVEVLTYVVDCLRLCQNIANASKHYEWFAAVEGISETPKITDFYQYFFTGVKEDVYVTIDQRHYGVTQISSVLAQFYRGLLYDLEEMKRAS